MVLFIFKEVSETINHLESAVILNYEMYSIFLGTRTNRGNRYRKKIDLCIKGCLKSKKSASGEIAGEIFSVKNWTQHLPCVHSVKFVVGSPVFPSPQKPTVPNSNSTMIQVDEEPLCGCATVK